MSRTPTRRQALAGGIAAGVTILAGCSDLVEDYDEDEEPEEGDGDQEPVEDVDHEDPPGELAFVDPDDGDEVTTPVEVEMDVEEFEVEPVDEEVSPEDGVGHLHVIVDHDCSEPGYVIPHEEGYHHLEDGELETELDLEPGEYDLCAQASDAQHNAYDLIDEVTIEVVEDGDDGTDGANDGEDGDVDEEGETDG